MHTVIHTLGPAFVHDLPTGSLANVDGDQTYVRVQVLTNAGALDRPKQLTRVARLHRDRRHRGRRPDPPRVLLTEAPDGGWGLKGHASTNAELVAAGRAEIATLAQLQVGKSPTREATRRAERGHVPAGVTKRATPEFRFGGVVR
jgi:hypothetical protein